VAVAQAHNQEGAPLHTLLYVEDNPANLKLVEQLIARQADLRLLTAVDANAGMKLARNSQPEVILMDINLPGLSGVEAMKLLREYPATAHIPIVAISANAMPATSRRVWRQGSSGISPSRSRSKSSRIR